MLLLLLLQLLLLMNICGRLASAVSSAALGPALGLLLLRVGAGCFAAIARIFNFESRPLFFCLWLCVLCVI